MDRREFVRTGLATGALAGTSRTQRGPGILAGAVAPGPAPKFGTGGILDAGVWEQQELMAAGKLTSHSLTSQYIARIKTIVNAVIEINPEALKIALEMDRERKLKRLRGPLHGIPVLLKDNIATADRMSTSAGPLALPGTRAQSDAHVAKRLRAAGAVIIGKTNLGDWEQLGADPAASTTAASSCAGPAIAAGLATLAIGTETNGAILAPASDCGLVAIKPTAGLVSRNGIIPLAPVDDTAGPMARSVTDAALMLWAIAGGDPADPATEGAAGKVVDYRMALEKGGLQGARVGVARGLSGADPELDAVIEKALLDLKAQGAQLIDVALPASGDADAVVQCLLMAHGIDALVAPTGAGLPTPAVVAVAGNPHITVPAGHVHGQPVGLSFVGPAYSEAALIRMAYSYEQATQHRRAPQFPASVSFAAR